MLSSILIDQSGNTTTNLVNLLICIATSVLIGLLIAIVHMYKNTYSKNFVVTLAILPILVQLVIMMVNGNLGAGVAVMGAFSLIRFRSVAGGAREITSIFWSMGVGLATGMGYIGYVLLFSAVTALLILLLNGLSFGENKQMIERDLRVTLPEDLDFPGIFDDIFEQFTLQFTEESVRTTNMGSLYEIRYRLKLKDTTQEKALMDAIRVRNGNLPVISGKVAVNRDEL